MSTRGGTVWLGYDIVVAGTKGARVDGGGDFFISLFSNRNTLVGTNINIVPVPTIDPDPLKVIHMSAEEMMASVDATLSDWRSAFELDPSFPAGKKGEGERGAKRRGGAGASPRWASDQNHDDDDPSRPSSSSSWRDPDGYRRRLGTFGPSTYFAKPLVLSPLVCAAFG